MRAAHSLKTDSAHLGARLLSEQCKKMEEMGRTHRLEGAEDLMRKIAENYEKVCSALQLERSKAAA